MTGPRRVRLSHIERLTQMLSARDWAIVSTLQRVRLASGMQLERLHFSDLDQRSRSVMRWRVLKRLSDARVLIPLERRIGAAQSGSARLCYGLDTAGLHLSRLRLNVVSPEQRIRRPRLPGERFIAHTLTVTELYAALVEHSRIDQFVLEDFQVEADGYWRNGLGGWVKPDAFVRLRLSAVTDYWWYEADLATESLPTIRSKFMTYLDFVHRGQLGPDDIVPRVIMGVPSRERQVAITRIVNGLPEPAAAMFIIVLLGDVAVILIQELMRY